MNLARFATHQGKSKEEVKAVKVIIDRFEGDYAIVELPDMTMVDMPISLVPKGAREGDVLVISIDAEETAKRKEKIKKLMDDLWE